MRVVAFSVQTSNSAMVVVPVSLLMGPLTVVLRYFILPRGVVVVMVGVVGVVVVVILAFYLLDCLLINYCFILLKESVFGQLSKGGLEWVFL